MAEQRNRWRTVSGFDQPADEVFSAFDQFVQASGIEARRFLLAPSHQAILISRLPEPRGDAIWRLSPEPIGGAVIVLSQDVGEKAADHLRRQISHGKEPALCRVFPRGRVAEPAGHLKGREEWFQRRRKDDS